MPKSGVNASIVSMSMSFQLAIIHILQSALAYHVDGSTLDTPTPSISRASSSKASCEKRSQTGGAAKMDTETTATTPSSLGWQGPAGERRWEERGCCEADAAAE